MIKRFVTLLTLLFCCSATLAEQSKVVRLAMPVDFTPYTLLDENGQCSGLFIDLWQLWAKQTGHTIQCIPSSFEDSIVAIEQGTADVHTGIFESQERRDTLIFGDALYGKATALIVSDGVDIYKDVLTIGIISRSAGIEWIEKYYPHFKLHTYESNDDVIHAAINGEIDGLFSSSLLEALTLISRAGNPTNLRIADSGRSFRLSYPVISESSVVSAAEVNDGFAAISDRLKLEIERRWVLDPQARYFSRSEVLPLTQREKAFIERHPEISVVFAKNAFAPFTVVNGDKVEGVDSEILKLISDRTGIQFKPVLTDSWPHALFSMREQMSDVVTGLYFSELRDDYMLFTDPYYEVSNVIVTQTETVIRRERDLANKLVAMPRGFLEIDLLRKVEPGVKILFTETPQEALMKVASGEAYAYVGASLNVNYLIERYDITGLKVASPIDLGLSDLRFAVRTDWPELQSILSKAINTITREELAEIKQRWLLLPYDFAFERGVWLRRLMWTGLIVLAIIFAFGLWNRRLSREIDERKRAEAALVEARKSAEQAAAAKAHFLATMSHEIRTPLNGVLGMLEIMSFSKLTQDQRKQLNTVYQSSKGLLQIINDVLDFSKSSEGKMTLIPVSANLIEVIDEVVELFRLEARTKGIELTTSVNCDHPYAHFDRMRLKQVLINIVGNAVKFTEQGSVHLDIEQQIHDELATIRFCVVDTGIGIDESNLQSIFTPFDQGDDRVAGRFGGSGLGLAISKEILDLMGSNLCVESKLGHGARFWFEVQFTLSPVDSVKSATSMLVEAPSKSGISETVLIVDDHQTNLGVLGRQLKVLDIQFDSASSGDEAWRLFQKHRYPLVLTDIQMPGMSGFELAEHIRHFAPSTVIIAVTANDLELDKEGADLFEAFLHKPVTIQRLTETLTQFELAHDTGESEVESLDSDDLPFFNERPFADLGLDKRAIIDLVDELRSETEKDWNALKRAVLDEQIQAVIEASHRMKGGAGSGGLAKIAHIALQIEEAGRANEFALVKQLLSELEIAVTDTWRYLDQWRN